MSNILITGANGQLGNCLRDLAADFQDKYNFYYTDVAELDITDAEAIEKFVADKGIDIIINAAAYTAVDKAEDEVELAYCLNRDAVRNLAEVARNHNCLLVHVSTDYIFRVSPANLTWKLTRLPRSLSMGLRSWLASKRLWRAAAGPLLSEHRGCIPNTETIL